MPNTHFRGLSIWTGRDATENQALRARLAEVAASLGLITPQGPTAGAGSIGGLLVEIAEGDAAVVGIDDYEHLIVVPWLRKQIAALDAADGDDTTLEDWLTRLADALAEASERRRKADADTTTE